MMPTIAIYDAVTGETTVREMNEQELAQYEADVAAAPTYEEPQPE